MDYKKAWEELKEKFIVNHESYGLHIMKQIENDLLIMKCAYCNSLIEKVVYDTVRISSNNFEAYFCNNSCHGRWTKNNYKGLT